MAVTLGGLINDPDALSYELAYTGTKELTVNNTTKKIKITRVGNLTADGVTLKCLYSKLKELWKSDATLIKYPFPMVPITDEQFEFVNGWSLDYTYSTSTALMAMATTGTIATSSVTSTVDLNTLGIHPGMYCSGGGLFVGTGGASAQEGAKIISVAANGLSMVIDNPHDGSWTHTTAGKTAAITTGSKTCVIASTTGITVGMGVSGTGIPLGSVVESVITDTSFNIDRPATATNGTASLLVGACLVFWGENDYPFNLIRTGAWATKNTSSVTQDEWVNITTLGNLGAQGVSKTLTNVATALNSTTITCASTAGCVVGSFVVGPKLLIDTAIASIDANGTTLVLTRAATGTSASGIATVRPKDAVYFLVGTAVDTAEEFALTGAVNQALHTYFLAQGQDDRGADRVLKLFTREQGYTYGTSSKEAIGETVLTYKKYAFPLSNQADLKITHTDAQIDADSSGIPDAAPYNTMSITWFGSPQVRSIGGVNRNFSVVVDADTGLAPGVSGTASLAQVYEYVQWSLRLAGDIDAGAGTQTGNTTRELLKFVGDTLYTLYDAVDGGVYIDNFNTADINSVVFADNLGVNRTFPYTAAGDIKANPYLVDDGLLNQKTVTCTITATNACQLTAGTTANMYVGYSVTGVGIPADTKIATIVDSTHFTIDTVATNASGIATTTFAGDAVYRMFFEQLAEGKKYGTAGAVLVHKANGDSIAGIVAAASLPFDFDLDGNSQAEVVWTASRVYVTGDQYRNGTEWRQVATGYTAGGTFGSTDTTNSNVIAGPSVHVTALGLGKAQAVEAVGTIGRSTTNSYSLVSALERNYANPV